jgi:hypothetical protein
MTPAELAPSPFTSSPQNAPTTNNGRLFAILHFLKNKNNREPLCEFVKDNLHTLQTAETLFMIKENMTYDKHGQKEITYQFITHIDLLLKNQTLQNL